MADALVSFVVQELLALAKDEVTLSIGAKAEVRKLSSMFTSIRGVLDDAEKQQVTKKAVQDWLGKLKEVAYEVEDILDEWRTDAFRSRSDGYDIHNRKVRSSSLFSLIPFKKQKLCNDIGNRIKEVTERLNQISKEKKAFSFNVADLNPKTDERETGSLINESEIFGRDHDRDVIISKLLCETSREDESVTVVSIVGMGGLGKTTLAQQVYNDKRVEEHFERRRIWVCVFDDFDVKRIATKVIESMDEKPDGDPDLDTLQHRLHNRNPDLDTLQHRLHEVVAKKRFLLILDDVWNENDREWEKLRVPLKGAAQGSKIVVTTRSRKVAKVMETAPVNMHSLGILSDPDCWQLFTAKAFKGREEEECRELKDIGEKIVRKCKGLPLAVKAVGSLLYFKRTKLEWHFILESETWEWDLPEDKGILPALLLSYYSLPLHLKQCFQFCSVFPKDHLIGKDKLVKLWMAHGIIRSERLKLEEIGESYFDDLLARSLFQDAVKYGDENIGQFCKMHDLVHDLAKFVTAGEYYTTEIGNPGACSNRTHHLSLRVNYGDDVSSIPSSLLCNAERLRTFILFGESKIDAILDSLFKYLKFRSYRTHHPSIHVNYGDDVSSIPSSLLCNAKTSILFGESKIDAISLFEYLKFLRALDLSTTSIENFPSLIGSLKHLRYLRLYGSKITELPEFVTNLCNLQTLDLLGCERLCKLPSGLSKMVQLRHLEIYNPPNITFLPHGLGMLTSLRTLSNFLVGDENEGCKITELKSLNLLRGYLQIHNLERVMNGDEAREAELDKKHYLRNLSLRCQYNIDKWGTLGDDEMERMESVFDALRPPHSNLNYLEIHSYAGSKFPTWLGESIFSSLVKIYLWECNKCRLLPGLGKLPSLKCLTIGIANAVNAVGGEFYGNDEDRVKGRVFPKLEQLSFMWMTNWEEWKLGPENGEVMSSLCELHILECPKLKALPDHLPITLRKVEIKDCNEMIWTPSPCHPPPLVEDLDLSGNVQGMLSRPLPFLPDLKTLKIECTILKSLPSDGWGRLESLHRLSIFNCPKLASLPDELGQLKALQTLKVINCSQLSSLPDKLGQLEALHTMMVQDCEGLTSLLTGSGQFKALQTLSIFKCPKLRSLSDGLVQLEALQTVRVYSCHELQSLFEGFEQLKALRRFIVGGCEKLRSLPELQHLTTLEELDIVECPLVTERFKKSKGEDWCWISHIPRVHIDGEEFK